MKYCRFCNVTVRTNQERCPLCQGELTGEPESEEVFPEIETKKEHFTLFLKWMGFACILISVVCGCVNWAIGGILWFPFVAAGCAMAFVSVYIGIHKRRNLLKNALWQMVFLQGGLVILDGITGWHDWSITWFLPIGVLAMLIFMNVVIIVQKLDTPQYVIYIFMGGLFGLLPLLFLILNLVSVQLPSVLCSGFSVIMLAAMMIFQHKAVGEEFGKKFHI